MGIFKKLGSHYAIERFGITFAVLFLAMVLVVGSITSQKIAASRQSLSGNAIYTRTFTMSQTGSIGTVQGIYSDAAHTRVFVLLKFDDMSLLPTKASDYRMFLAGCTLGNTYETLKSSPSGFLYVFGTTGYMGIYLQDVAGFPSQLVQLYLRANVNFTGRVATQYEDDSFNKNNQAKIVFNPGGSYATHADFLETDHWTAEDMVEEILCRQQEMELRNTLYSDLMRMVEQQLYMEEYSTRLKELNVVLPSAPTNIASDQIYALDASGEYKERLHYITNYGGGWVNATGTKGFRTDSVVVYFDSPYLVPKGFDFDWQDGRVLTGYLEKLTGTTNLSAWINYLSSRVQAGKRTSDVDFEVDLQRIPWKMVDGSVISLDPNSALTQQQKDVMNTVNLLVNAWKSYYKIKEKYETEDLPALLQLESDFRNSVDAYTVNVGDGSTPVLSLW